MSYISLECFDQCASCSKAESCDVCSSGFYYIEEPASCTGKTENLNFYTQASWWIQLNKSFTLAYYGKYIRIIIVYFQI